MKERCDKQKSETGEKNERVSRIFSGKFMEQFDLWSWSDGGYIRQDAFT